MANTKRFALKDLPGQGQFCSQAADASGAIYAGVQECTAELLGWAAVMRRCAWLTYSIN